MQPGQDLTEGEAYVKLVTLERDTYVLYATPGEAQVWRADASPAELDTLVAEIAAGGGEALALAGDVRSEDYAQALVALAAERFGRLDIAINNAGTAGRLAPLAELEPKDWHAAVNGNLTSAFLAARAGNRRAGPPWPWGARIANGALALALVLHLTGTEERWIGALLLFTAFGQAARLWWWDLAPTTAQDAQHWPVTC